jgi:hypothetical protein
VRKSNELRNSLDYLSDEISKVLARANNEANSRGLLYSGYATNLKYTYFEELLHSKITTISKIYFNSKSCKIFNQFLNIECDKLKNSLEGSGMNSDSHRITRLHDKLILEYFGLAKETRIKKRRSLLSFVIPTLLTIIGLVVSILI